MIFMDTIIFKKGDQAPNFCLPDQNSAKQCLSDSKGSWVLLYFYPKDATPGCTVEACSVRDNWPEFSRLGIRVIGVSADSVESHNKFASRQRLQFPILSDANKEVVKLYGIYAPKKIMGKEFLGISRTSFLINPQGLIEKVYPKVNPATHIEEVLKDLTLLMKI
jgi:thioredoxin-dependent peroxiredoxin